MYRPRIDHGPLPWGALGDDTSAGRAGCRQPSASRPEGHRRNVAHRVTGRCDCPSSTDRLIADSGPSQAGRASNTLNPSDAAAIPVSLHPARESSSRYSCSLRSLPPTVIIVKSARMTA